MNITFDELCRYLERSRAIIFNRLDLAFPCVFLQDDMFEISFTKDDGEHEYIFFKRYMNNIEYCVRNGTITFTYGHCVRSYNIIELLVTATETL